MVIYYYLIRCGNRSKENETIGWLKKMSNGCLCLRRSNQDENWLPIIVVELRNLSADSGHWLPVFDEYLSFIVDQILVRSLYDVVINHQYKYELLQFSDKQNNLFWILLYLLTHKWKRNTKQEWAIYRIRQSNWFSKDFLWDRDGCWWKQRNFYLFISVW